MKKFPIALTLMAAAAFAQAEDSAVKGRYFDLAPNSVEELSEILGALDSEETLSPTDDPIVIMLHGKEADTFVQPNYDANKTLVDQAAKLDAFGLIDVRICQAWLAQKRIQQSEVPAFVDVVPFARKDIRKLEKAGFRPINKIDL